MCSMICGASVVSITGARTRCGGVCEGVWWRKERRKKLFAALSNLNSFKKGASVPCDPMKPPDPFLWISIIFVKKRKML